MVCCYLFVKCVSHLFFNAFAAGVLNESTAVEESSGKYELSVMSCA